MNGSLYDFNGNKSSKRINGTALVISAAILMNGIAVTALSSKVKLANGDLAFNCGLALLTAGCALLGITMAEWFAPKK